MFVAAQLGEARSPSRSLVTENLLALLVVVGVSQGWQPAPYMCVSLLWRKALPIVLGFWEGDLAGERARVVPSLKNQTRLRPMAALCTPGLRVPPVSSELGHEDSLKRLFRHIKK